MNVEKEKFYGAKKSIKTWDIDVDNVIIYHLYNLYNLDNRQIFICYLDKVIRLLVLTLPKMNGYIETFKDKDEEKNKNNVLA